MSQWMTKKATADKAVCQILYRDGNFCHVRIICISLINTSMPILLNTDCRILITVSMTFVPRGLGNDRTALVKMMAWRRIGDKPLSLPTVSLFILAYIRLMASRIYHMYSDRIMTDIYPRQCWQGKSLLSWVHLSTSGNANQVLSE